MVFDNVVLDVICKQIDDPQTYFNFSLVNKKCKYISSLNETRFRFNCIIRDLEFISRIRQGDKPNFKERRFYGWFQSIQRIIEGKNRNLDFEFLCNLIRNVENIIDELDKKHENILKYNLLFVYKGIFNLTMGYDRDTYIRYQELLGRINDILFPKND